MTADSLTLLLFLYGHRIDLHIVETFLMCKEGFKRIWNYFQCSKSIFSESTIELPVNLMFNNLQIGFPMRQ